MAQGLLNVALNVETDTMIADVTAAWSNLPGTTLQLACRAKTGPTVWWDMHDLMKYNAFL